LNPLQTLQFILRHPLNRGRPVRAVARYARWQVESRLKYEVEVDWIGGTKLVVRNGMTGATGNIYCGLHEYEDMSFVLHVLKPGDLFVDVGSNIGSYTILASGVCGARSIAIEPDPQTAAHLERNIAANSLGTLASVVRTAVGAQSGEIGFTKGHDTMNRVAIGADEEVQKVPLATLDDILADMEPTLIKMDVEGFEHAALSGAGRTLAKPSLLAVQAETVEPRSLAILRKAGFERCRYDPATRELANAASLHAANALFVRDFEALAERLRASPRRPFRGRVV
jgi:FkbM family methyltransferase